MNSNWLFGTAKNVYHVKETREREARARKRVRHEMQPSKALASAKSAWVENFSWDDFPKRTREINTRKQKSERKKFARRIWKSVDGFPGNPFRNRNLSCTEHFEFYDNELTETGLFCLSLHEFIKLAKFGVFLKGKTKAEFLVSFESAFEILKTGSCYTRVALHVVMRNIFSELY
jgi:hypothetical protein